MPYTPPCETLATTSTRPNSKAPVACEVCCGNLPWVSGAAGYRPKLLDMIDSRKRHTAREPYNPYQETTPPLQAKEAGRPT
jgi:hypothetical protein